MKLIGLTTILLFAILSFATNTVFAQEEAVEVVKGAATGQADGEDEEVIEAAAVQPEIGVVGSAQNMEAAKRFQLTQIFAVEIEEIARVCELDNTQITKLTVGAKGAVKKMTAHWIKTSGQQLGVVNRVVELDADGNEVAGGEKQVAEKPEVEITDADQIDIMTIQMVIMGDMGNPFNANQPTEHEFWQKTLASVLSENQAAKLGRYRSERNAAKRQVMIAFCMDTLKVELALSDEQQAQLSALVTPAIEKAEIECFSFLEPYLAYYHASKVEAVSLAAILSQAQLQKWKLFMAPAKQIEQMREMEAQAAAVEEAAEAKEQKTETDDDK